MADFKRLPTIPPEEISIPSGHRLSKLPLAAGLPGALLLALAFVLGLRTEPRQFWFSYLSACLFWVSIALGALFFVLVQFASRAGWSVAVRRLAEHTMYAMVPMALLLLLLIPGAHDLYHWTHEKVMANDPVLQSKAGYLNLSFFYWRGLIYLLAWLGLSTYFRRQSLRQDRTGDPNLTRKLQARSAPSLILYGLTVTFAAFDWIMSLDPHWFSTIFGVYFFAGCFLSGLAFLILLTLWLQRNKILTSVVTFEHFHDLGKLLFGFVVFWAYIAFSQFMLIWYANLPEETAWFGHRMEHGWEYLTLFLVVGHFGLPFFFLLSADVKRKRITLSLAASWLLLVHYADLYWLVMPTLGGFHPNWLDLACLLGVGGVFIGWIGYAMRRPNLVPIRDPRLPESLTYENI